MSLMLPPPAADAEGTRLPRLLTVGLPLRLLLLS